uniref:Uncharacterized protein n=1 Tax=Anguilla anguilla TaxID=7936 RepID=A0A0E9VHL0_ANGAN
MHMLLAVSKKIMDLIVYRSAGI